MIEIYKHARELPIEWDAAVGNNFALYKSCLELLEVVNPCGQTYILIRGIQDCSIFMHYELKLNIFSYSSLKLNLKINIIGVPCSVSEPGYNLKPHCYREVNEYLKGIKGAKLILNAGNDLDFLGFIKGYTLPTCKMKISWNTFEEYLNSLRSHYRYRYKKALEKSKELTIELLKDDFNHKHYSLYEQVYNKSEYKLEKLTLDFFRKAESSIIEFKLLEMPVAFVQYIIIDKKMIFLFGGLDYNQNKKYDLYLNMLLQVVKSAIENNCNDLNLGQTAEEIKCKLGAIQEVKYLYMQHSNPIINMIVSKLNKFFSYKMKKLELKVLKR